MENERKGAICPVKVLKGGAHKFYPGCMYTTNEGYVVKVIEYVDYYHVLIEFIYNGFRTYGRMGDIINGSIKNPFHPNRYGGYFGVGPYDKNNHLRAYNTWIKMLERLTEEGQQNNYLRNRMYVNVSVCQEWYNYQNFACWYENYIGGLNTELYNDYQIDKDILQWNQQYKIYSPTTCCLVPSYLNIMLSGRHSTRLHPELPTGVTHRKGKDKYTATCDKKYVGDFNTPEEAFLAYKNQKEKNIKALADHYLSINAIHKDVYDALYKINIIEGV